MKVTQEQFGEFVRVQKSGHFNMFDPNARLATDLSKDMWFYIMKNYALLLTFYPEINP